MGMQFCVQPASGVATAGRLRALHLSLNAPVIAVDALGLAAGAPPLPPDWRDSLDERYKLGDVVRVRAGQDGGERNPLGLGDDVMLAPQLPSIRRIRPRLRLLKRLGSMRSRPPPVTSRVCRFRAVRLNAQHGAAAPLPDARSLPSA